MFKSDINIANHVEGLILVNPVHCSQKIFAQIRRSIPVVRGVVALLVQKLRSQGLWFMTIVTEKIGIEGVGMQMRGVFRVPRRFCTLKNSNFIGGMLF